MFAVVARLTACLRNRFHRDLHGCQHSYCAGGGFAMGGLASARRNPSRKASNVSITPRAAIITAPRLRTQPCTRFQPPAGECTTCGLKELARCLRHRAEIVTTPRRTRTMNPMISTSQMLLLIQSPPPRVLAQSATTFQRPSWLPEGY